MSRRVPKVIDTNVAVVANGREDADRKLAQTCAAKLLEIRDRGHVVIDDRMEILKEYRDNLRADGQPGVGDAFFKWLWDNQWNEEYCTQVAITPLGNKRYAECPDVLNECDASDRKFMAVALAHPDRPSILQATDSKWWGWRDQFQQCGLTVEFLADDIEQRYLQKMG